MSCGSAIYTVNQSQVEQAANSQIPFGSALRRYGRNIRMDGSAIRLHGSGYYDVCVSCTVGAVAEGEITVQLMADGNQVPGAFATATATAAGDTINLSINSLIRLACCDDSTILSLALGDASATPVNIATVIKKV